MTSTQLLVILIFFAFTGWAIASLTVKMLFRPLQPVNIFGFKMQGIIPAKQMHLSHRIGHQMQSVFLSDKTLDEKLADPASLEKLKPTIEQHIDHFLREKIKTVFPLLAQFMGEKTLNQFKAAFLVEIDNLFPVIMKNYVNDLKQELHLDRIIADKINAFPAQQMEESFYKAAGKGLMRFKLACTIVGLFIGIIAVLALSLAKI